MIRSVRRAYMAGVGILLGCVLMSSLVAEGKDENAWKVQAASRLQFTDAEKEQFRAQSKRLFRIKQMELHEQAGRGFALRILTHLPAGARLYVAIHFAGKQVGWGDPALVTDGEAMAFFGPYRKQKLLLGEYAFTVHYDPSKQPMQVLETPGVPLEERVTRCRIRVGTSEEERVERAARRRFYLVYLRKVSILENEQQTNYSAALMKRRFVIGSAEAFDHSSWRTWVNDWRDRFQRKVFLEIMRARDEGIVALRYPRAYTAIQGLYRWNVLLNKALSRELYHKFGKEVHPEDLPGEDRVSLIVIRQKIEAHRSVFEQEFGGQDKKR